MMKIPKLTLLTLSVVLAVAMPWRLSAQEALDNALENPNELLEYANGLYGRKFYDMALAEFNKFIVRYENDPRYEDVLVLKSNCLEKLGRHDEFIALSREFCEKYPQSKHILKMRHRMATLLFNKKQYSEAAEAFRSIIDAADIQIQENAIYFLYRSEQQLKHGEEALRLCKSLADKPLEIGFQLRQYAVNDYAQALYENGNLKQALQYYQKMLVAPEMHETLMETAMYHVATIYYKLDELKTAEEALKAYLVRFPEHTDAKNVRKCLISISARDSKNVQKTMQLAKEWRQKYPESVDWDVDSILANVLLQCKMFNEAIPYYMRLEADTAVPADDRRVSAFNVAYCLFMAGHYADAAKKAVAYVEDYPRSTNVGQALILYAESLMRQEKYEEALEPARKAMAFFDGDLPNYENACMIILNAYEALKRDEDAVKLLFEMADKFPAPRRWEFFMNAAKKQQNMGDIANAIETYRKIAGNKDDLKLAENAWNILLQIHLNQQNYQDALKDLQGLMAYCTEDRRPDLDFNIAYVYFKMSDYDNAGKILLKSLESKKLSENKIIRANVFLATIYLSDKKYKDAMPILEQIFAYEFSKIKEQLTPAFMFLASDAYLDARNTIKAENVLRQILVMENAEEIDKLNANMRIAKFLVKIQSRAKESEELLQNILTVLGKQEQPILDVTEVQSYLAEAQLAQGKYTSALIAAEKALKSNIPAVQSRALYVLAYVKLNEERRPDAANKLATQCFILFSDPEYSPLAMGLSIRCFLAMNQADRAKEVFGELSAKYPEWVVAHPEVGELLKAK